MNKEKAMSESEDEFEKLMNEMEEQNEEEITEVLHQMKLNEKTNELKEDRNEEENQMSEDESDEMKEFKENTTKMKSKKLELLNINHETIDYCEIYKNLYIEVPSVSRLSNEDVIKIRKNELEGCLVKGKRCPKPISRWSECGINEIMYSVIKAMKFENPTPVQRQAIPAIMSGFDVIVSAKTGSGKTLAYILPLLKRLFCLIEILDSSLSLR